MRCALNRDRDAVLEFSSHSLTRRTTRQTQTATCLSISTPGGCVVLGFSAWWGVRLPANTISPRPPAQSGELSAGPRTRGCCLQQCLRERPSRNRVPSRSHSTPRDECKCCSAFRFCYSNQVLESTYQNNVNTMRYDTQSAATRQPNERCRRCTNRLTITLQDY